MLAALAWPDAVRARRRAAEERPDEAGRLPLPRRARAGHLRRQGEVAAPARALVLPGTRPRPADDLAAARSRRGRRGDRHAERGRGLAPRAEPRQAAPSAVQRAAPR